MNLKTSILFLGKKDDPFTLAALGQWTDCFQNVESHLGGWGEPFPKSLKVWEGDYIISFLSRWVVPKWLLERAEMAALNFHPAPPEYPGIGCNNFALYDNAREYGTTCHHMAPTLDSGPIVAVRRFAVLPDDNVESLLKRTYEHQLDLHKEVVDLVVEGKPLFTSTETWKRKAYTRTEFNELCRITPDMDREEMARRIRATSFGKWKPTIELNGFTFELKD